jgi:hypothetical protein
MEPVNFQPSKALPPNPSVEEIEQDILNFLEDPNIWPARQDNLGSRWDKIATFATFERRFGRPRSGGLDMTVANQPNVVLWQGLSENLATAVGNLIRQRKMHWHGTFHMYYSRPIPLPIASDVLDYYLDSELEVQAREFSKPHWFPVQFFPGPFCDSVDCPNSPIPIEEREKQLRPLTIDEIFGRKH